MTPQQIEDVVGYLGSQLGRLLIIAGGVASALIAQGHIVGEPWVHVLGILGTIGSVVAAYMARPFDKRDASGNLPARKE